MSTCRRCGGLGWVLEEKNGTQLMRPCRCLEKARREELLKKAQIPPRYAHCTLDNFEIWNPEDPTLSRALKAVRKFVDAYPFVERGLLLMGPVGTGKTHLAVAALKELILGKGRQGLFADFTSVILELQMRMADGGGETLKKLVEPEVLVLDELGAGRASPWVMDVLYYLVNTRYMQKKTTLFTTNYSDFAQHPHSETLEDRISTRLRSRLYEMCTRVELRGLDYRKHRLNRGM